ncbi:carboxypeptidase regulatory-like domain-containing protein [Patescibacteria group bacterium]|nr:carboxypeptidase regulatory-like domain-containing protein [Patescibacteria group bacterium]
MRLHTATVVRFRLLAIFLVIFLAHLFPATAAFAGNISYPQDSYIFSSTNNITLTVRAGSAADAVVVSASTINVTLAANDTFELIEPGSRHLPNTQGLPECTVDAQGNHLVMGPFVGTTTIVVTPSLVDCGGSSGNGGSGGIVITYPNDDTGSDEADGKENTNANSPISINDNANANDNENNNVNQQENTNANTNSDVEQSNANVPINIPLTNDGVGAGNSNTPGGQGTAIGAPVVVTPGDGTVIAITQPTISGTAMPNTQVDVLVDAQLVGSALSSAAGIWSLPLPQALLSGGHLVVAVANGVQSAPVQFVIDVTPPLAPAIVDAKLLSTQFVSGKIYDTSFFVSGIAPEQEDILFSFDGGTALKGLSTQAGAWQTTLYATLTEGDHMLAVQAVDLLGNVSAATLLPFRVPLVGNAPQALQVIATGTPPVVILIPECSDGKDNDGDGWVDFPADAGCRSREGNDEASDKRSALSALQGLIPGLAPLFAPIAAVIEHPVVQQLNQTIAAPTALVIVSANAAAALPELGFLTYLRFLFLQPLLLFRRRRRGWGTVYNSMTKLPVDLAIVRLYDTAKHRLLRTTVTDRNGRFLFFVPPGAYRLEVTKPQFVFPSTYVQGKTADAQYANVYSGAMFTLKNTAMIAPNIPIDPHMREKPDREVLRDAMKQKLHTVFSSLGIFLAAGIWFVSPTVVNTIALAVHVGLFFLFRRLARGFMPKTWGVISDLLHRKPLAASVVRIFEPTYHRLLETQVTDPSGKYAFLVGRNRYYLTVAKQGYKPAKSGLLDLTTGPDRAVVAENVAMEPVPESGPAAQTPATQTVVPASETSASATQHVTESPVDVKK